jgi:hypothetical protein
MHWGEVCAFAPKIQNKGRKTDMRNNRWIVVGVLLALALTGVCGVASRATAQELVKARFTLTEETRFGNTVLPAGQYTLLVEPISQLRPVGSPVAITVRSESASTPFVSVLATASQEGCDRDQLKLISTGAGQVAQSMCLEKQGLTLHFDGAHANNPL